MPEAEIRKRGGAIRWRTIKPTPDTYQNCAIVIRKGKHGGRTVCGKIKQDKIRV